MSCAGYLPKFSSSFAQELLNDQATDFTLARRVLADYHPLQPEMIMQLAAQQHPQFLCPGIVRKFVVPVPWQREPPTLVQNYMTSSWKGDNMSLLEYLQKAGSDGQVSQRYRRVHKAFNVQVPVEEWIKHVPANGQILVANVMYTHSNDRYFGQWLLLNVPFRRIDDLWHPEAARLPEALRYLGLCVLHRPRFWRDPEQVRRELRHEARTELYIDNKLDMLASRIELIDAYFAGELTLAENPAPPLHGVARFEEGNLDLAPEQAGVIAVITDRVEHALQAKFPEERDVEAWGVWLDAKPSQNKVTVVLGPAGSGKSTAVEVAMSRAIERGAHVGVACPTGMLATRYRARHPDVDVDTVHGMFALHKDELATADMMQPYDLIVIDEVGQLPTWIFDRLLRLWDAADRRPALVFVGDFCQLTGLDGTTAKDSLRWGEMHIMQLREMRRCKCPSLRWKLELLRSAIPSSQQLKKIVKGHRACLLHKSYKAPAATDVAAILRETPNTVFVTISRRGSARLSQLAIDALFADSPVLDWVPCDPQENFRNFRGQEQAAATPYMMPVYEGMRVRITRNIDKENGFVNGMGGTVQRMRRNGVQVRTDEGEVLLIHKVTQDIQLRDGSWHRVTAFPLRLGYSTTLHKVQGATLPHITIWMDIPYIHAAMYVALSRVQHDRDWRFIASIGRIHCLPARLS